MAETSLERLERREFERAPADSTALSAWAVDLVDGQVVIGNAAVHPTIARDLYLRLGALLEQQERDQHHERWATLSTTLDRAFSRATPAHGNTLGQPSTPVHGQLLVESENSASLRVATFAIAALHRTKRGWEGAVFELRPTSLGHDRIPTGMRVRVAVEVVPPRALPGPTAPPPPPALPPSAPVLPARLQARRDQVAAQLAAILRLFTADRPTWSSADVADALVLPRHVVRAQLELLAERGELAQRQADHWVVAPPIPRGSRIVKKGGTRFVNAPKPKKKPSPRPSKPAPTPAPTLLRCQPCNRSVRVPGHIVIPAEPRCAVCGGLMARWA